MAHCLFPNTLLYPLFLSGDSEFEHRNVIEERLKDIVLGID